MFDKLDAYNLVANLVPGAALTYALHHSKFPAPPPDNIAAFLLAAFVVGVTVNRLGSLVLDPILRAKKIRFLKPKNYKSFVTSERDDSKLEILVANAGLYRTFLTAGTVYFGLLAFNFAANQFALATETKLWVLLALAMLVFLFALKKEDNYFTSAYPFHPREQVERLSSSQRATAPWAPHSYPPAALAFRAIAH